MTVFIHIGLSKTGTTSIQRTMFQNADRLRKEYSINYLSFAPNHWSIALPFLKQREFSPLDNHVRRGHGSKGQLLEVAQNALRRFGDEAARYETHVVSAEQLQLLNRDSADGLRAFFAGCGFQTKAIVYIRHPAERISSLINQKIRAGQESLDTFPIEDSVTPTLRTYVDVFGKENVIIRRFGESYFANGDLIDDFVTAVHGAPIAGLDSIRLNESLSMPAVLFADQLFAIAPRISDGRGNEGYLTRIAGPKFLAPRSMVRAAVEAHQGCLDYLEAEFEIRFDEVDLSAFPEKISREFSAETLASIATILNEQSLTIDRLTAEARAERSRETGLKHWVKKLFRSP